MRNVKRLILGCLVLGSCGSSQAARPAPDPELPEVRILAGDWGDADPEDIRAVCLSAARELLRPLGGRRLDPIAVRASAEGPMVLYGRGKDGERRVLLNVKGRYWSQLAFQFAHELGHILCNYREADRSNHWFEESLCETASLFALRRMAEAWKKRPPYPGWNDYAPALARYAQERIARVPPRPTLGPWYRENEAALRAKPEDRERNLVAAVSLLALVEKDPTGWRSVGWLNQGEDRKALPFRDYLADWRRRAPKDERAFVDQVARLFELSLE